MKNLTVKNLINANGNATPNQFEIFADGQIYFQSYESLVAEIDFTKGLDNEVDDLFRGVIKLGRHWDYSRTTMKHLNTFLRNHASVVFDFYGDLEINAKSIRKLIADGVIAYDVEMI